MMNAKIYFLRTNFIVVLLFGGLLQASSVVFDELVNFNVIQQLPKMVVVDSEGLPLIGVNVLIKETGEGIATDYYGGFKLDLSKESTLVFSYLGYETQEVLVSPKDTSLRVVMLPSSNKLNEVFLVGSRNPDRTITDSPVPVDVITLESIVTQTGKMQISDILQYAAPSFNANKQTGSDGADHIVPATLRGLGPDQVLVLINGKRRHQSSLVNLFGTRGRGNTGTDLNAIPRAAIKRIEVLRDGAAAQYGSDAIAGVINIVTKDASDAPKAFVSFGAYNTNAEGNFPNGTPNTGDNYLNNSIPGNATKQRPDLDGESLIAGFNYGVKVGKGGFVNITGQYNKINRTLRPSFDFRRGFGSAALEGGAMFVNAMVPLSENTEFYAFGGSNFRDGDSYAFTRNPTTKKADGAKVVASIYPRGFTPKITANIIDNAITAGIKTRSKNNWNIDFSNTYGKNIFHYYIKETLNASLGAASPTQFDAGGHSLSINTTDLDFSKHYDNILSGFNLALGAQYRVESFEIFSGEKGSYATYDTNGVVLTDATKQTAPVFALDGGTTTPRPGGSQGFPGYSPSNEVNEKRNSLALYLDTELDITESILLGGAVRFENYSDFGETINGKLSTRIKIFEGLNFRASASTGFRAPSLAQLYYNLKFTNFNASGGSEVLLSSNISPVTKSFGIDKLKQETSIGGSAGFAAKFGILTASVDTYWIDVTNRILLTGYFKANNFPSIDTAQFFVNGANTQTIGVDIVLSASESFGENKISANLIGNINNMSILNINNGNLDENNFFGKRDQKFLLASAPKNKFSLNFGYERNWFNTGLTFTRFGEIELIDYQALEDGFNPKDVAQVDKATDKYSPKIVTDLVLGFTINKNLKFDIGSNNFFNVYPDQQDDWTDQGGYWDAVQMGIGGAYYFARANYTF